MPSQIMTADQAFNLFMNKYPNRLASETEDDAKMKFYNHVFNVIGNGCSDNFKAFKETFEITLDNRHYIHSYPKKYNSSKSLFYFFGDGASSEELYSLEDLKKMPKKTLKIPFKKPGDDFIFYFYPNFKKEYSMVWQVNMKKLDHSWIEAAIVYYQNAKNFFNSENVKHYFGAYTEDDTTQQGETLSEKIERQEKTFKDYRKEGMTDEEHYKLISNECKLEYNGDTKDFLKRSWEAELTRILSFIDETLLMLKAI